MEAIHVVMAMIVGLGGLMLFLYADMKATLSQMQGNITDIDRRLCRLEGAFASKDCCMIKDSRHREDSA